MDDRFLVALETVSCAAHGKVPGNSLQIRLSPAGHVKSSQGDFVLDAAAGEAIVAEFESRKLPVPVDFEHQTLGGPYAAPHGRAPAAGWINKVWFDEQQGLLALVEWTEEARAMIRKGEYRFISPVLLVRKSDRRAIALHSAGLTNKPAIGGQERLAAKELAEALPLALASDTPGSASPIDLVRKLAELVGIDAKDVQPGNAAGIAAVLQAVIERLSAKSEGEEKEEEEAERAANAQDAPTEPEESEPLLDMLARIAKALRLEAPADPNDRPRIHAVFAAVLERLGVEQQANTAPPADAELVAARQELARVKADHELEGFLRPWRDKGLVGMGDDEKTRAKDEAVIVALAQSDPEGCVLILEQRKRVFYPPQGRTTPPTSEQRERLEVIGGAVRAFKYGDPKLSGLTSCKAYVNDALREAGLGALQDAELKVYSIPSPRS